MLEIGFMPAKVSRTVSDAVSFKTPTDGEKAFSFKVLRVDSSYDLGFFRNDDKLTVLILGVAEEAVVVDLHFAFLVSVLDSKLYV